MVTESAEARKRRLNNEAAARYRKAHPERTKAAVKRWEQAHADHLRAYNAKYRADNPEKVAEFAARWRKKDGCKAINRVSRLMRRAVPGWRLTTATISELMAEYGGICPYCNRHIKESGHVDHIVPIANGGDNRRENLVYVCAECNMRKGAKNLLVFLLRQVRLCPEQVEEQVAW